MNDNTYDWDTEFQKICNERNSITVKKEIYSYLVLSEIREKMFPVSEEEEREIFAYSIDGGAFTECTFIGRESQYEELVHLLKVAKHNKSETLCDRLIAWLINPGKYKK